MSSINSLLDGVCFDIESRLMPRLSGLQRFLIIQFLPQIWVFETEDQAVSLIVDQQGRAFTQAMNRVDRDVTIRWKHEYLASVLKTKSTSFVPLDEHPTIIFHTQSGRTAFDFLREQVGLQSQIAEGP